MSQVAPVSHLPSHFVWTDATVTEDNVSYKSRGLTWSRTGKPNNKPVEVYPGLYQGSDEMLAAQKELSDYFSTQADSVYCQVDKRSTLCTDFARPATLAPYSYADTEPFRVKEGCNPVEDWHKGLLRDLMRDIIRNAEPSAIYHRDSSSSGAPYFIRGKVYKRSLAKRVFKQDWRAIWESCRRQDVRSLRDLGIWPVYTQGIRKHAVAKGKERMYQTYDQIMSGSMDWTAVNFSHPSGDDWQCYDVRSMYAANSSANMFCQVLSQALTNGLNKVIPKAHFQGEERTKADIESILNANGEMEFELVASDYSKFGETFPRELIEIIFEELEQSPYRLFADIAKAMLAWPRYFRWVDRNQPKPILSWSFDSISEVGLKAMFTSGHACVSIFGLIFGCLNAMIIIGETIGLRDYRGIKSCQTIFFWNKGDDTLWLLLADLLPMWQKALANNSIFKATQEKYPVYLGSYYLLADRKVIVAKDAVRHLSLFFNAEHSYRYKSMPRYGVKAKIEMGMKMIDGFADHLKVFNEIFVKHTSFDFLQYASVQDNIPAKILTLMEGGLNAEELMFIENPDLVHYKAGLLDKISPELFYMEYSRTEVEDFKHLIGA